MSEIKIGTKVTESRGGYGFNGYYFTEIVRETRTQWVCESGTRYRKLCLRLIDSNSYGSLKITTDEHIKKHNIYVVISNTTSLIYDLNSSRNHIDTANFTDITELKKALECLKTAKGILFPKECG